MSTPSFRFRQFEVYHDRCAMKVGTDAVLLGAWCPLQCPLNDKINILDVGTGSGVIALMLAQRLAADKPSGTTSGCPYRGLGVPRRNGGNQLTERGKPTEGATIHAIDIDPASVEQARENFARSPWADSLTAECISFQDFVKKSLSLAPQGERDGERGFALIVSNPPYFRDSLRNPDPQRREARHTDSLTYEELIAGAATLLVDNGLLGLVLPAEAESMITSLALEHGLYAEHILYVRTTPDKAPKRILIAFRKSTSPLPLRGKGTGKGALILSDSTHPRTPEYAALTRDFYL